MTAADRLAESEAITAAATKGPWRESWPGQCCENNYCVEGPHGRPGIHQTDTNLTKRDATFIAYARSALPKRDAALRAVLALHSEAEWVCGDKWCSDFPHGGTNCVACGSEYPDYPCPTVRAIEEALA